MTTENIDAAGRYVRLTADDGRRLTSYDPDMDDIRLYASYACVATAARHAGKYREITLAEADAYAAARAEAEGGAWAES